jgi:DNA-binding NarL/FixJ family response regulator
MKCRPARVNGRLSSLSNSVDICLIHNNYIAGIVAATRTAPTSRTLHPDVLICDISSRQVDGIELVRKLRAHAPALKLH